MNSDDVEIPAPVVVGSLAEAFLAYESLVVDMRHVINLVDAVLAEHPAITHMDLPAPRELLVTAMWDAAVITYGRAFGDGKRRGYANRVPAPSGLEEVHRSIRSERNNAIAHLTRVDRTMAESAVLRLADPRRPRVNGVGRAHVAVILPNPGRLERIREAAAAFADLFDVLAQRAADRIITVVNSGDVAKLYGPRGASVRIDEPFPPPTT